MRRREIIENREKIINIAYILPDLTTTYNNLTLKIFKVNKLILSVFTDLLCNHILDIGYTVIDIL